MWIHLCLLYFSVYYIYIYTYVYISLYFIHIYIYIYIYIYNDKFKIRNNSNLANLTISVKVSSSINSAYLIWTPCMYDRLKHSWLSFIFQQQRNRSLQCDGIRTWGLSEVTRFRWELEDWVLDDGISGFIRDI